MASTTVTQVPYLVGNFYDRTLLERGLPLLTHAMFAQVRDIPKGNSNVIKFRRYGALSVATTPLIEGVTPLGQQLSVTDVPCTVNQYGDFVYLTDWVRMTTIEPILTETAELLGESAGQTLDTIIRDVLVAGTTIQYADAVANRAAVTSSNKLDAAEIKLMVRTLKRNNAKRITSFVNPDAGFNSSPVDQAYIGIVHPDATYDLQSDAAFVPVEKYQRNAKLMPGEVGKLAEVRFIETTFAKVFDGEGDGGIDVYATLILAKNAYGVTRISGESMRTIIKQLGSAGTADPLDQRSSMGWKATLGVCRLNESFMGRIEHATTA